MSYKLVTYRGALGVPSAGMVVNDIVYDVARVTKEPRYSSVSNILEDWTRARSTLTRVAREFAAGKGWSTGLALGSARLFAPLPRPGNIYCAGANYTDHMLEMAKVQNMPPEPDPKTQGRQPWHFVKSGRSTVVGPGATVKIPAYSTSLDWEIELAAVIGTPVRNATPGRALNSVAGYTIANDLSARDHVKRANVNDASPFKWDWVSQKCFDGSCPLGPWIVPASDIPDPQNLGLKLWVGDELMQDSHTSQMIFSLVDQIVFLSSRITLQPGDLILTGTPAGVGMARKRFLKPGETMKLWIEGIGELVNKVG